MENQKKHNFRKYKPKSTIINGKKQCRLCNEWKDVSSFGMFLDRDVGREDRRYINSRCKQCANAVTRDWQIENRQHIKDKWIKDKEEMLKQIRGAYGNKCACCGETNPLFLTIDHINNDGYKLRPRNIDKNGHVCYPLNNFSGRYYRKIIKSGFPKDLQLLCWNCNCGKSRNHGICPHKVTQ